MRYRKDTVKGGEVGQGGSALLRSRQMRFALVGVPAAVATFGLFLAMDAATQVNDFVPPKVDERELVKIALPEINDPVIRDGRKKPKPILPDAPPPPPKFKAPKADTDVPIMPASWSSPNVIDTIQMNDFVPPPAAISERTAQPIAPPIVTYPQRAADRGIEGVCDVTFDVSLKGQPFNVKPICSHSVFEREAKRAIQNVSFLPRIRRGQPVERRNVVYPLEFELD